MTTPRFDAHCHIFNPRYSLKVCNRPVPGPFTVADYQASVAPLGFTGGAVISSTAQGFHQGHLLDALRWLGPGYVGVTRLPATVADAELDTLNGFGVRGLRLALKTGEPLLQEQILAMGRRVHRHVGWHVELAVDARELADLEDCLSQLPALCLDHRVLSRNGLPTLLRLAEQGAHVKICGMSGFNATSVGMLKDIHAANPNTLMLGTGLPLINATPDALLRDLEMLFETLGDSAAQRVLWNNAASFYRLQTS
ncbi:amidohydrolase family protein [Pseudomonas sp. 21LCFQ010]|uniref:amidohydrolase family protein n=1 Tax=Pseudomonas sp. 21LCFQ010 TaxID=2957506 RepID=UPI0020985B0D|nr:amidohydrolase family protein [Pseudomonas sp. 21LCFQ010]MCO8165040.1 amidohydrolase family protein [Pseudomonas sp. 21LCFQ010]